MTLLSWLSLIGVCALGAMSPGPSLAVILQNRVQRGLGKALVASWAHATGIFFWALVACTALGTIFLRFPAVKTSLTLAGAAFLIYLAIQSWGSHGNDYNAEGSELPSAFLSGLSISILNPKILVFFTALFSQFVPESGKINTLFGMAIIAGVVDGTWYSFFSFLVGQIGLDKSLKRHSLILNRVTAVFYLVIAGFSLSQLLKLIA